MILVVGLSSVWQRTLFFDAVHAGDVNRAKRVVETASGKGVNVARVATILGAKARVLTVAGGKRGELFCRALKADGVDARVVPVRGETRVCQTLIGGGVVTELVEESPKLTRTEVLAVVKAFERELKRATMVVLSGTVPVGCGEDFYARLARMARRCGVPVVVDTQRQQLMNVVREKPILVKVNRKELETATGCRSVESGVKKLGVAQVVISDGARPVRVFGESGRWAVKPSRVEALNPIGSGDAMLAGMVVGLMKGKTLASASARLRRDKEAVQLGVACGAANALTETSGVVRRKDVLRLLKALLDSREKCR